ncbi:hypothetical protein A2318_03085 [Candidatus Uhrbacteria bacterium RIFOXYB2_FULL_45_11]|uniref:Uncharacterized protein n=1 Tax=Candidatus Uhrbacteria bacterium RIFOXYB2_FULL_45_11 TaxID=1802421 RepID=A0A1F7WBR0_9BACT|nr:MAG: hypothetical protein A2318_03085 [Candidatus Uhrbacteria bacterium RIFOXYB2_FULL_45_11]
MDFSLSALNIPVFVVLIVYAIYILFYVLYSLFNLFHLMKYGVEGVQLFLIVIVFTGGTILLVAGSIFWLLSFDWTVAIPLNQILRAYNNDILPISEF